MKWINFLDAYNQQKLNQKAINQLMKMKLEAALKNDQGFPR
jgi:hypothetical protein